MILYTTDKEFLLSMGVEPYDPEQFAAMENDRFRTRIVQTIAVLQLVAIVGGLAWTWLY